MELAVTGIRPSLCGKRCHFLSLQGPDGVEDTQDHDADISEDGQPHVGDAQCPQEEAGELHADGEPDDLNDGADALAGDGGGLRDL